ncbi:hypothetical protein FQR65_LT12444 [Abscondita terminalis]|nr:hypothetical protein FQR65_LT12444 [Abscondita terminalis]
MFLKLLPSDVPGATLSCNLHDHSVQELRRWLECRGLNQSGRKEDLIERIRNCIDNGRENEISIAIDGGKWYNRKRNADPTTSSSLVETLSKSSEVMFNPFPSVDVPEYFNKGHIYSYLILNVADHSDDFEILNEETGTMEKPLQKANQLLVSDHLSNLMDGSCENRYFIKCECKASFKNKIYNVHVTLNRFSGAVTKSKCECLESSTGKCSHVTALLLLLSKFVNENGCKVESVSTTSRIRQWRLGRKVCSPGSINTEHAMSRYQPIRRSTFDPRPSNYTRNFSTLPVVMEEYSQILLSFQYI